MMQYIILCLQDSLFLIDSLHDVLELDATLSSHPIVQNVSHPDQITEIFDTISYNKVMPQYLDTMLTDTLPR